MIYAPAEERYESMTYRYCGRSGLKLPRVSLGLWQNFGSVNVFDNARAMLRKAFDLGICHFDLANNYGPEPGSAEENFGRIFARDFKPFRDELLLSSKAGFLMWPGPYGEWGSRKNLIASCDQSLRRMGVDYVDIFYHHRPDPETPLEESMGALSSIVRSGKALYAGISNYPAARAKEAFRILRENGTPCLIHQFRYNMFARDYEKDGLFETLEESGVGGIVFSPLAQGTLSSRYLSGIPAGSRASRNEAVRKNFLTPERLEMLRKLDRIAVERGMTLSQLAILWIRRQKAVTSTLIGASSPEQIAEIAATAGLPELDENTIIELERILTPEA